MESLIETYKKTKLLHHAYCLEGERGELFSKLRDFFESQLNFLTKGNPDFWYGEFDTFGIDDGRLLKVMASRRPLDSVQGKKIFVIAFNFITREAQNSLLKTFEEPTEGTHFFIITPSSEILLPTLKSRLFLISPPNIQTSDVRIFRGGNMESFLAACGSERIKMLKKMIDEKDKAGAISFLNDLEVCLRERYDPQKMGTGEPFIFEEIRKCRSYLHDRAPSVKMILEYIAILVPSAKNKNAPI